MDKVARVLKMLPDLLPAHVLEVPYDPLKNLRPNVTYQMGVCGIPMTRVEYYTRCWTLDDFLSTHSIKVRFTTDQIADFTFDHIDEALYNAGNVMLDPTVRAECAFRALAWHTFFDPFSHPNRKHFFKKDFLYPILEGGSDAYYKWAVYINQEPDSIIYNKMKAMHPETTEHYFEYCANIAVARREGRDISWLTNW